MLVIFADNTLATAPRFSYRLVTAHPFGGPFVGALAAPVAILAYRALAALPRVRRRPALQRALVAAAIGILAVVPLGLWTIVRPLEIGDARGRDRDRARRLRALPRRAAMDPAPAGQPLGPATDRDLRTRRDADRHAAPPEAGSARRRREASLP